MSGGDPTIDFVFPKLVNAAKVMAVTGLSRYQLDRLIKERAFACYRMTPGTRNFDLKEVCEALARRERGLLS